MISHLKETYSINFLCQVLTCLRSGYYYQSQPGDDEPLVEAIEQILLRWPFHGYRRVLAQLRHHGWVIGETRVRRLLKQLNYSRNLGRVREQTTDSRHNGHRFPNRLKGVTLTEPDQAWVMDITFIRLGIRYVIIVKPAIDYYKILYFLEFNLVK